jgi:purine nucleoside phosphorylase
MMVDQIREAYHFLVNKGVHSPEIGIVLGTGLGHLFAKQIKLDVEVDYASIPHFPISTVETHKGKLIYGSIRGKKVMAMHGRFHFYERILHATDHITNPGDERTRCKIPVDLKCCGQLESQLEKGRTDAN